MNRIKPTLTYNGPDPTACRRLRYALPRELELELVGPFNSYDPNNAEEFLPDSVWYVGIFRNNRRQYNLERIVAAYDGLPTVFLAATKLNGGIQFLIRYRMLNDFSEMVTKLEKLAASEK